MKWILPALALLVSFGPSGCTSPLPPEAAVVKLENGAAERRAAPLFDNLGSHEHAITTSSPLAQRYFNQGLTLVYAFNHGEAIRSLQAAALHDPSSAMAHWGVALAYGPNINAPMSDEAARKAYEALQRAIALDDGASEVERAYIEALSVRYAAQPVADRSELDRAYADAMREVARRFPDDLDAATLFAEALMDTVPWNYWAKDQTPRPQAAEAIRTLESVLSRSPYHPGANHYYIHVMEAGPEPEKALPSADRLRTLVPGAGHLVHMPAHIYVRLGRYSEASFMNDLAIQADEAYIAQTSAQGFYPALYYPHNMHFLWFSTSMEGRSEDALRAARRAAAMAHGTAPERERLQTLPLLVMVRFGKWDAILKEPRLSPETPFTSAIQHLARGLALTALGKLYDAAVEQARLQQIVDTRDTKSLDSIYLPGSALVALANTVLQGEIALARGDRAQAVRHLEAAVRMEDDLPYMEPPYWYPTTRHYLGAALLDMGRSVEAEAIYRRDLEKNPNDGWSLQGLAQSLTAQGKGAQAAEVKKQLEVAFIRADIAPKSSRY